MAILTGNSQLVFCLFIFYHLFILLDGFVILFYVSVCISTGTHAATGSSGLVVFLYREKNGFTESPVRRFMFLFMFFYAWFRKSCCGLK